MNIYPLIMCGGSGTRLWPISREKRPKQFLQFFDGKSLFQQTISRTRRVFPEDHIRIVAPEKLRGTIKEQAPFLSDSDIFIEPEPRDTAACIALSARHLQEEDPESGMIVLPSDHLIEETNLYETSMERAQTVLRQFPNHLLCFGITPTQASTGYGYLEKGPSPETNTDLPLYEVQSFKEKPDQETAKSYLQTDDYFWNSGMFAWKTETFLQELNEHANDIWQDIQTYFERYQSGQSEKAARTFSDIRQTSVDYAVMENARDVLMLETSFTWNDFGSLDALEEILDADDAGNVQKGTIETSECSSSVLYSDDPDHLLAVQGLENLIVVHTDDVTLVCPRENAQQVKQLVSQIQNQKDQNRFL